MSALDALLERWTELELAWCARSVDTSHGFHIRRIGPRLASTVVPGEIDAEAAVLMATIEAINARSWQWSMTGDDEAVQANVNESPLWDGHNVGPADLSPTEALLTAYLNALEATEGTP